MRAREGFTMVEVLVSLVLLASIFMALSGTAARYAHGVSVSGARASALQLANDRIEEVRLHPRYGELTTQFQGIEFDVNGIADSYRRTQVTRMADTLNSGVVDVTVVTVEVFRPGLTEPVERTTTVGAP